MGAGFGFVFWVIAARSFSSASVGVASAAVSAVMLLGVISMLGLGTLLIRELPRHPGREPVGWIVAIPYLVPALRSITAGPIGVVAVIAGVAAIAVGNVVDQALIGLLRSDLQLFRNAVLAAGRVALLALVVVLIPGAPTQWILAAWAGAAVASLAVLAGWTLARSGMRRLPRLELGILRGMSGPAAEHHMLNLAIQAPGWMLPVITVAIISAESTASFYTAWMLVGLASFIPVNLTWALYAEGARNPESMGRAMRVTLGLSGISVVGAVLFLIVAGGWILGIFGARYAADGSQALAILSLTLLPVVVKGHFIVLQRVHGRVRLAAAAVAAAAIAEILGAGLGAWAGGVSPRRGDDRRGTAHASSRSQAAPASARPGRGADQRSSRRRAIAGSP
jgi:O-antigen/teichoic acid export membrane protein